MPMQTRSKDLETVKSIKTTGSTQVPRSLNISVDKGSPNDSLSCKSRYSTSSRAAIRVAELKARQAKEELELETKLRLIRIQHEMEMVKAQAEVLEAEDPELENVLPSLDKDMILNRYMEDCGNQANKNEGEINTAVKDCGLTLGLPKVELSTFDGNISKYWSFMKQFEYFIERRVSDDGQRLLYLMYYCRGHAKEAIEDCIVLPAQQGYQTAKGILREAFGQPHIVARNLIDNMLNGTGRNIGDSESLMRLSRKMTGCAITLSQMDYAADLDSINTMEEIVHKLTVNLQTKWSYRADTIIQDGRVPKFDDLSKFISEHARVSGSRYGQLARENQRRQLRVPTSSSNPTFGKFKTVNLNAVTVDNVLNQKLKEYVCWFCNGQHKVENCDSFTELDPFQRQMEVRKHKRCFVCLKGGHLASECWSKNLCGQVNCHFRHHALLHNDANISSVTNEEVQRRIHTTQIRSETAVQLGIVPVRLEGPLETMETYAFLDNGSDTTLIRSDVIERLGIQTTKTSIRVSTVTGESVIDSASCKIRVSSMDDGESIIIDKAYCVNSLPVMSSSRRGKLVTQDWSHLKDVPIKDLKEGEVTLLIGCDSPEAHWVLEQRVGGRGCPYAIKTLLGWIILGPSVHPDSVKSVKGTVCHEEIQEGIKLLYNQDFLDFDDHIESMSIDDKKAVQIVRDGTKLVNGHYEIPLPWKTSNLLLPNNLEVVIRRMQQLRSRLLRDKTLRERYCAIINRHIEQGYLIRVTSEHLKPEYKPRWYLPHHPVMNPKKPDKVRIVFDFAAKYRDKSLNDYLYQGPDATNNLTGVLMRFRSEPIALVADIEEMFLQVKVPVSDQGALRILWWRNSDLDNQLEEYQLTVHPFGATSSPYCAHFALEKTVDDFGSQCSEAVKDVVRRNFYVDDCLISLKDTQDATAFIKQITNTMTRGGFRLRKWVSNSKQVLSCIPESERSITAIELVDGIPAGRTLGLVWDPEPDVFRFSFQFTEGPMTRRGLLSSISSLFDPLGLISPILLPIKCLLQNLCKKRLAWDDQISEDDQVIWKRWLVTMEDLREVTIPRCLKLEVDVGVAPELHIFCDASEQGYGAVAYARFKSKIGTYHCRILYAKARVAPLKVLTIPRLELSAAVVGVRIRRVVEREMCMTFREVVLWTDSTIVLHYINNTTSRFSTFISNRLQVLHELSTPDEWRHVSSRNNPADLASRGIYCSSTDLQTWLVGPTILYQHNDSWPKPMMNYDELEQGMELKKVSIHHVQHVDDSFLKLLTHYSSWCKLLKAIAWWTRFKMYVQLMKGVKDGRLKVGYIKVNELHDARDDILRVLQRECFPDELQTLSQVRGVTTTVKKGSALIKLSPIILNGLLCVGGRLANSSYQECCKHPIILPKRHHITDLIIDYYHKLEGHSGVTQVLSTLRQKFWIVHARSAIQRVLRRCTICRRQNAQPGNQMMSSLPSVRVESGWYPFMYVGLDYFGPFLIHKNRSTHKRYGCIFTCLQCRAVHLEIAENLDTDSFILVLMRFINRRGKPKIIYSDNGSNFVGAVTELREQVRKWNLKRIHDRLLDNEIEWCFNPPMASHRGGIWERLIRTVRRILNSIMAGQRMTDETLITFFTEVERVLNNRPIIPISNSETVEVLRPNNLIAMRELAGVSSSDTQQTLYVRKWKQVNQLASTFWKRWVREYLPTLQMRQKWTNYSRNFQVGDLVLVINENNTRDNWPLGVIEECFDGDDGLVRTVMVRTTNGTVRRDIRKICLLEGVGESIGWPD